MEGNARESPADAGCLAAPMIAGSAGERDPETVLGLSTGFSPPTANVNLRRREKPRFWANGPITALCQDSVPQLHLSIHEVLSRAKTAGQKRNEHDEETRHHKRDCQHFQERTRWK